MKRRNSALCRSWCSEPPATTCSIIPGSCRFTSALCEENLALGVHVGWSCPSINNLYSHIYPSGVIAFHVPLLMAFTALISGGVLIASRICASFFSKPVASGCRSLSSACITATKTRDRR